MLTCSRIPNQLTTRTSATIQHCCPLLQKSSKLVAGPKEWGLGLKFFSLAQLNLFEYVKSKYTPEDGQKKRLPESTCDIMNQFFQKISLECEEQSSLNFFGNCFCQHSDRGFRNCGQGLFLRTSQHLLNMIYWCQASLTLLRCFQGFPLDSWWVSAQDPGGGAALIQWKPVVPLVTNGTRYNWLTDTFFLKSWLVIVTIRIESEEYIAKYAPTESLICLSGGACQGLSTVVFREAGSSGE